MATFDSSCIILSKCQYSNCAKLQIVDDSINYGTNLTINGNAVTSAIITFDDVEYDVTSIFTVAAAADNQGLLIYTTDDVLSGIDVTDGVHTVNYTLTTSAETISLGEQEWLFICELECCIWNKIKTVPSLYDCTNCKNQEIMNIMHMWTMYNSMKVYMALGDVDQAENIFDTLTKICENNPCNC